MDQIVSLDMIQAKAREEFARGAGRDDHGFNWGAPAIDAWQKAWDECDKKLRHLVGEGAPT